MVKFPFNLFFLNLFLQSNKIKVIVRPNSKKNEILGYDEARQAYRVAIKAPAENGKANAELVKFFKKSVKKDVKIISGFKSKEKVLIVE